MGVNLREQTAGRQTSGDEGVVMTTTVSARAGASCRAIRQYCIISQQWGRAGRLLGGGTESSWMGDN